MLVRAHDRKQVAPDGCPKTDRAHKALATLLGLKSAEQAEAALQLLPAPLRQVVPLLFTPVTPQITSPAGGAFVRPGANLTVQLTTNAPTLPHELLLLSSTSPITVMQSVPLPAPVPATAQVLVPLSPGMQFYLEFGLAPSAGQEDEQRHRILVKTPQLLTTGALTPSTAPASGVPVTFTVNFTGGMPPYVGVWIFDDGQFEFDNETAPTLSATHTYVPGNYTLRLLYSDGASTTGNLSLPFTVP